MDRDVGRFSSLSEIKDRGTVGAFTGILTVVTVSSAIRLVTENGYGSNNGIEHAQRDLN